MTHIVGAVYTQGKATLICKEAHKLGYYWKDSNARTVIGWDHETLIQLQGMVVDYPKEDSFDKMYERLCL